MVSTGKSDWPHDVSSESGSLAQYLSLTVPSHPSSSSSSAILSHSPPTKQIPGVYSSSSATKTTILNGSHFSLSDDPSRDTVLILPDYKFVTDVEKSTEGAQGVWEKVFDSTAGARNGNANGHGDAEGPRQNRVGDAAASVERSQSSRVLPYACVILLCK